MVREPVPMTYVEAPPAPPLAPYVAAFWRFAVADDAGEIEHRIPLTGGALALGWWRSSHESRTRGRSTARSRRSSIA